MKKILLILIATTLIFMTGDMVCSIRTVYAADTLVDINVSSGGKKHKHHDNEEEKTEKEKEVELSRANIEAQEEALKLMPTVQVDEIPAIRNADMLPAEQEPVEKVAKKKPVKTKEPKTAGSDLPIIPITLMIFFTDMLLVAVESAGDFDDYIRRGHVEKLVEKYKKGGKLAKITAKIELYLCLFYSRLKARSDRNMKSRHDKCNVA